MTRRTKRGSIDKNAVLRKLREARDGAILVRREAAINSTEYEVAGRLNDAVDDMVEALTGDREYFWEKWPAPVPGPGGL